MKPNIFALSVQMPHTFYRRTSHPPMQIRPRSHRPRHATQPYRLRVKPRTNLAQPPTPPKNKAISCRHVHRGIWEIRNSYRPTTSVVSSDVELSQTILGPLAPVSHEGGSCTLLSGAALFANVQVVHALCVPCVRHRCRGNGRLGDGVHGHGPTVVVVLQILRRRRISREPGVLEK